MVKREELVSVLKSLLKSDKSKNKAEYLINEYNNETDNDRLSCALHEISRTQYAKDLLASVVNNIKRLLTKKTAKVDFKQNSQGGEE